MILSTLSTVTQIPGCPLCQEEKSVNPDIFSWESKGTLPMPQPTENKALLRDY